jgi:hypothetical protein
MSPLQHRIERTRDLLTMRVRNTLIPAAQDLKQNPISVSPPNRAVEREIRARGYILIFSSVH